MKPFFHHKMYYNLCFAIYWILIGILSNFCTLIWYNIKLKASNLSVVLLHQEVYLITGIKGGLYLTPLNLH